MPPKADTTVPPAPPAETDVSGKLVIMGILTLAVVAASGSWLFRYNATHRAALFWDPEDARLIRDAPNVYLHTSAPPNLDVSSARGLVHLRNALLEDRSFNWPAKPVSLDIQWEHGLIFNGNVEGQSLPLFFSSDFKWVSEMDFETMLSCEPIAAGLREMFAEFAATMPANSTFTPATPAR